jgi:replicative DNA helicase
LIEKSELENIPNEIMLVGSFYKSPELYISYGSSIKSKYDFAGEVTKFFYDCFEVFYQTMSQKINETKINSFMFMDDERLQTYKKYGGFKTINDWMNLSEPEDFDNYFAILKKYSLVREFHRGGYNVEKLVKHKKFDIWSAQDIFKMLRSKVDKIHTVILSNQESVILNENAEKDIKSYVIKPQAGLPYPWVVIDEMFKGMRLGKAVLTGFLSNEGKTRNLVMLMSYIALIRNKPVLIMSNEMDEEDLKSCLITTVANNECFQKLHGVKIKKMEGEIVLGKYRDHNGVMIERKKDKEGEIYIESEEDFLARLERESDEYNDMLKIGQWIDSRKEKLIFFKNVGTDYSDQTLEFEIRKHKLLYGVDYVAYDTMKGFRTDDWMTVKQSFTKLKELMSELNIAGICL